MRRSPEVCESKNSTLLNSQNGFKEGVTARAVVERDGESVVLVGDSSESEISLLGCDVTDEECDVFGLVMTVTSIYYDTEGRPNWFMVDPIDRFAPTESEIAAARGEAELDGTSESGGAEDTTEDHSSGQSDESGQSNRNPSVGVGTGIVVDGSGERDKAGRSPVADSEMMKELLGNNKL